MNLVRVLNDNNPFLKDDILHSGIEVKKLQIFLLYQQIGINFWFNYC
jgi:hypothetical protein